MQIKLELEHYALGTVQVDRHKFAFYPLRGRRATLVWALEDAA